MSGEQAREMTRAHPETTGQCIDAGAVERAFLDEGQRTLHRRHGAFPGRAERSCLGTASEAGTKAPTLRRGRTAEEFHIARERGASRTHGPAVDTGGLDRHEHDSVQCGVAASKGIILRSEVEHDVAIAPTAPLREPVAETMSENDRRSMSSRSHCSLTIRSPRSQPKVA